MPKQLFQNNSDLSKATQNTPSCPYCSKMQGCLETDIIIPSLTACSNANGIGQLCLIVLCSTDYVNKLLILEISAQIW